MNGALGLLVHSIFKNVLFQRIASALVLAPVVLAVTYAGAPLFHLMMLLAAGLMVWEWWRMSKGQFQWLAVGVPYIVLPVAALMFLRDGADGMATIFWLYAVVWGMDIGGYLFGRLIGGPKLAPRISPNKTWAGLIGGMALGGLLGLACARAFGFESGVLSVGFAAGVAFVSQCGDLLESSFKRRFGAKDSSQIIPGHGGLLDRVDGLMAAAVFLVAVNGISGRGGWQWL